MPSPGLVTVLAYNGLCTFEFGIAVEVFDLPRPEFDFPWYQFAVGRGGSTRESHGRHRGRGQRRSGRSRTAIRAQL